MIDDKDAAKKAFGDNKVAQFSTFYAGWKAHAQHPTTYTEEDMRAAWQQGYSNGLLYDMSDELVGEKPDFTTWLTDYKQSKS